MSRRRPVPANPSMTVKMDFRGDIAGDFVYHCHDGIVRVLPRT